MCYIGFELERAERMDGMRVELLYVNLMRKPLSPQIYPALIPPASNNTKLWNYNRIYCNIPLRISLHYTGDGYNAARGKTKRGFVQTVSIKLLELNTLRFHSSKHFVCVCARASLLYMSQVQYVCTRTCMCMVIAHTSSTCRVFKCLIMHFA